MGCIVSGCPAGLELSEEYIQRELDRRKPGQSDVTTSRDEPDAVRIKSGLQDGYTTGTPIGMEIQNRDSDSSKYHQFVTAPRPSHGDYTYSAKFGTRNWGGGGRSSARETVNWVAAGAIAKKILQKHGIHVKAHTSQLGEIKAGEVRFDNMTEEAEKNTVRCADQEAAEKMEEKLREYKKDGDSIGGAVYFEAQGLPTGLGAPRFDGFTARLSQALGSIPAVTSIEYGLGKDARTTTGKERNDEWNFNEEGDPEPVENSHGGIQGDITSGKPVYGELTFHAPTSIPKDQKTVDWETGEEKEVQVTGRHDPSLPPRAVPVVESVLRLVILDFMLLAGRINPDRLDNQPGEYDTDYHPSSPLNNEGN